MESVTKGATTTSLKYSPDGLRYKKATPTKTVLYHYNLDGEVIAESDGSNTVTANYVWGPDRALVKKDAATGNQYYYLYNGHGDVVQIVDTNGNVVNNYQYDEWGNILSLTEGIENSFKYAGEIYDAETGLYYLRARYYDPQMGRFINEDTYEGQINNPLTLNLYTYCHNDPLGGIDPTGHTTYPLTWQEAAASTGTKAGTGALRLSPIGVFFTVLFWGGETADSSLYPDGNVPVSVPITQVTQAVPNEEEKAEPTVIAKEDTDENKDKDRKIYRLGNGKYSNLTPRPGKDDVLTADGKIGLSFQFTKPSGNYIYTTIKTVNATGVLIAVPDGPDHVSVRPAFDDENYTKLKEWAATRPHILAGEKGATHEFTYILANCIMGVIK